MKNIIIGTLSFLIVSFTVQALSHFAINADHFASVSFMKSEPILSLGVIVLIIQGVVLTKGYQIYLSNRTASISSGLIYSVLVGSILITYIALVEPSKYDVPSITQWVMVEGTAGLIQFGLFGILLGATIKK